MLLGILSLWPLSQQQQPPGGLVGETPSRGKELHRTRYVSSGVHVSLDDFARKLAALEARRAAGVRLTKLEQMALQDEEALIMILLASDL